MKPIMKWPGGKSREIAQIQPLIPSYDRYIEPFFGGGAMFFHLMPSRAVINDKSRPLMEFYQMIKAQDKDLRSLLLDYRDSLSGLIGACDQDSAELASVFNSLGEGSLEASELHFVLERITSRLVHQLDPGPLERLILDRDAFFGELLRMAEDKFLRTARLHKQSPLSPKDLRENLITGFASGYYMYFRGVYNDLQLGRTHSGSEQYKVANYYFIREYCYGSMFRYNTAGEFNIPYGGMSYNRKDFKAKVDRMFCEDVSRLFANTDLFCTDFEELFAQAQMTPSDFMFLDPPYDTDFSDYEGVDFTRDDQKRLAGALKNTPAQFILVIKNTPFIRSLYENDFHIVSFDKKYTYNVRCRNSRETEHLIITNLPTN